MTMIRMRTFILTILAAALLHAPFLCRAEQEIDPSASIEAANKAYIEGSYHQAIMLYEQIRDAGWESPYLYYNLANAYFKSGSTGQSILNYERALRLKPSDDATKHNLQLVRQKTIDQVEPLPVLFIWNWRERFVGWFHTDTWAVMIIAGLFLACISLTVMMLSGTPLFRKILFSLALVFLLMSLVSWYAANRQYNLNHVRESAIVMAQRTTAKSSPGERGVDLFAVHEGLKVFILTEVGDWYEVKLENGRLGWLPKSSVEII